MRVSVCMATWNGEKYIQEQLLSILKQLADDDEVIICDDASYDNTVPIVMALDDQRIKVTINPVRLGHVRNFEKAISLARGSYVFLSDQDDIWPEKRVSGMIKALDHGGVVTGNYDCIPQNIKTRPYIKIESFPANSIISIWKILLGIAPYFGSAMGFKRDELHYLLPFPRGVEAHDIWIAINANIRGVMVHLPSVVLHRRLHDSNFTPRKSRRLKDALRARLIMIRLIRKSFSLKKKHQRNR